MEYTIAKKGSRFPWHDEFIPYHEHNVEYQRFIETFGTEVTQLYAHMY